MWKSEIDLKVFSYNKHHIDSLITSEGEDHWRFTGFYGSPMQSQKIHSWNLLRRLAGNCSVPWLCGGDFNEILKLEEKKEGLIRSLDDIEAFKDGLVMSGLSNLGYDGYPFTWSNRRYGEDLVEERLDRFV